MKILGISGSHRAGNTDALVKRALAAIAASGHDTEFVSLAEKDIGYCTDCGHCKDDDSCIIDDDLNDILAAMKQADAIVVGSPVYFGGVTAKLKSVFDRTLPLRRQDCMLTGKIGGALAVGGSRNGGQELTIGNIHAWMFINGMVVVGDSGNPHFGGAAMGRNPGDALQDDTGLSTVDGLAESISRALSQTTR